MNPKASATLEKVFEDRRRSNFKKALSRLEDGIDKFPQEFRLYAEAIDVSMEAGEALKALQFFKKARQRLPDDAFELWSFTTEKVGRYNDPIVGKFLVDSAMKAGELSSAHAVLENLKDHTAAELLQRLRPKKQTHTSAIGGGFAAGDELSAIAITESLVCLRLNRFPEAADGFVRVLDEKPTSYKLLEPFLSDLEKQHAEKGEVSFALGCCYIAGAEYSKGFQKLIRAARIAPSLASDAITRIESLEEDPDIPTDERELRLAELYMEKGENHRAVGLLRSILDRGPGRAADIIDVLTSRRENVGDDLEGHFLSIDAALALGRTGAVVAELRKIYRVSKHRTELLGWLEKKSKERGAPVEILLFFGETALEEKMTGKAIEIFKEILSHGPQEEPTIKELLSRHQSVPLARHYYNELFGASTARERASQFEFQTHDNLDLSPGEKTPSSDGSPSGRGSSSTPPVGGARDVSFAVEEFSFGEEEIEPIDKTGAGGVGFDNRDFSLSMHDPPDSKYGKTGPQHGDGGSDSSPDESRPTGADPANVPSGPRDDDVIELPADSSDPHADFDSLYQSFLEGNLDGSATLELIDEALTTCRWDEMRKVLTFEPSNLGEEIGRKRYLAEYYLASDRPLPALITLKSVNLPGMDKGERKEIMLRIAACYEAVFNFEAAHSVYLRIISEHPGAAGIERQATSNYEKYVQKIAGAAPVLEKITTL